MRCLMLFLRDVFAGHRTCIDCGVPFNRRLRDGKYYYQHFNHGGSCGKPRDEWMAMEEVEQNTAAFRQKYSRYIKKNARKRAARANRRL